MPLSANADDHIRSYLSLYRPVSFKTQIVLCYLLYLLLIYFLTGLVNYLFQNRSVPFPGRRS